MNAQGYRFVDDKEEALPMRDLSLLLPITPPRLTPNTPAWRQRERRKAHFLRSLSWLRRKPHTTEQEVSMRWGDRLLEAWLRLPVELQEKLSQYYSWREATYQSGEQVLPSFLSDVETELKTKAR